MNCKKEYVFKFLFDEEEEIPNTDYVVECIEEKFSNYLLRVTNDNIKIRLTCWKYDGNIFSMPCNISRELFNNDIDLDSLGKRYCKESYEYLLNKTHCITCRLELNYMKPLIRANLVMDMIEACAKMFKFSKGIYLETSNVLLPLGTFTYNFVFDEFRYMKYGINIVTIKEDDYTIVYTKGFDFLGKEELYYKFDNYDIKLIKKHIDYMCKEIIVKNIIINDSVDCIYQSELTNQIKWKCSKYNDPVLGLFNKIEINQFINSNE